MVYIHWQAWWWISSLKKGRLDSRGFMLLSLSQQAYWRWREKSDCWWTLVSGVVFLIGPRSRGSGPATSFFSVYLGSHIRTMITHLMGYIKVAHVVKTGSCGGATALRLKGHRFIGVLLDAGLCLGCARICVRINRILGSETEQQRRYKQMMAWLSWFERKKKKFYSYL